MCKIYATERLFWILLRKTGLKRRFAMFGRLTFFDITIQRKCFFFLANFRGSRAVGENPTLVMRGSHFFGRLTFLDSFFSDSTENYFSFPCQFFFIKIGYRIIFVQHEESRGWKKKIAVKIALFAKEIISNRNISDERNDGKRQIFSFSASNSTGEISYKIVFF